MTFDLECPRKVKVKVTQMPYTLLYLERHRFKPYVTIDHQQKGYMASPMITIALDLEMSNSRSPRFQSLISRNGAELDPMLLLTINRKPIGPTTPWHLTLSNFERSYSWSVRVSVVGDMYSINIFANSLLPPLSEYKRDFVARRGFRLSQRSFLLLFHTASLNTVGVVLVKIRKQEAQVDLTIAWPIARWN